ncbi:MAG: polysaccharide pyruvyl transferase family protein [Bacillota bacterium]
MIKIITPVLKSILMQTKELTLVGYYGVNNFGDDLMLKSIIDELCKFELKINVITFAPIPWLDQRVNVFVRKEGKRLEKSRFFHSVIRNSSLILWGGGTVFTDEDGDGYFLSMMYAKLFGKKFAYVGVGIGNMTKFSRRLKTRLLCNMAKYISFRDKSSYNQALQWRITNKKMIEKIEDPANYLLQKLVAEEPGESLDKRNMVLAWRDLREYDQTTIGNNYEEVARLCLELCLDHEVDEIILLDTDSTVDQHVNHELFELIHQINSNISVQYNRSTSFEDKLDCLKRSNIILTSRLHVAVTASFLKKKCYVYNYSPKIKYFVEERKNKEIILLNQDLSYSLLNA